MAVQITTTCPHNVRVHWVLTERDGVGAGLRATVRELLLACPACKHEAEGYLTEPGE